MKAVGYLRLSTKDQSKSLQYQESIIRDYCKRNKLTILEIFKDNGESSDTFDRRNYLELEKFIKKHKGKCQYLVVLDHDRFSRNLPEALTKIAELERKHNVKVISTNEPIDLDTSDPDVFMKRAFDYLIANRELLTIRNRTRQGIRNAKENGRHLGKAPFGYRNLKNSGNGRTIEIDESQSFIIEKIFRDYEFGVPPNVIHKSIISLGFKNTGNSTIRNILENCVYAGLTKVPAYKNLPEKYVRALHPPIVSEVDFWRVQKLLKNKRTERARENEDFPLRGIIKCPCGQNLTAGWTKGKNKYYLYYKCTDHPGTNIPGKEIHGKFEELLRYITLQKSIVDSLNQALSMLLNELSNKKYDLKKERIKSIEGLNKKIAQLENKFITDQISITTYKDWSVRTKSERAVIEKTFQANINKKKNLENLIKKFSSGRINLYKIYNTSTVFQKHMLVRIIFRNNLTWDAGLFTSSYFNECLQFNLKKSGVKALLSITELKSSTTEVINKDEFGLTTPQMRRARRTTDQKRKPEEIEKESQFIDLITELVAEIIKSDLQNKQLEHTPTQHTDNQKKEQKYR
ncbi:recombinase family protein [Pedobacter nyackensis]|uniref:recombinase family protein n=1 Tax=Pedobacter nyackensis TaxID=475255 RepID=UPI00292ECF40|nr:recombinase family protein [Pedobacter nyackensis]